MLLEVKNATFTYERRHPTLTDISFSMEEGQIFCVVGRNGCGKTTLLDCVMGFHTIHSGQILLDGKGVETYSSKQFASIVSYVPQAHTATFPYTVSDVVVMGRTHAISAFSSPSQEDRSIAQQALLEVGMAHLKDRMYTELSGGELQMVLLARALAQQTRLIIMDEPTDHLDFKNEWEVLGKVASLVKEKHLSVLMATHFLNQPFFLQNAGVDISVALMEHASFKQVGCPEEVLTEQNLFDVYDMHTRVLRHEENGCAYPHIIALHIQGEENEKR